MIYDFISSYRPSYLPKTWVFSAQSAEPLRHRHAHDQEVLSWEKNAISKRKEPHAVLFWRVYLCIYCIYVWKNYLLIMIHLTCSFACIYIDVLICLFVIYFFIYAFIYLLYSFIYLCRCVHVLWFVEVLGLAKNPHKMVLSGASPISKHIPNSMAARRRHSISRIYLSNTFDDGTQKNTLWNQKMLNMMTWYFDSYY